MAYQVPGKQTSNDLFRGAILESGSATALTAVQHKDNGTWQASYNNIVAAVRYFFPDPSKSLGLGFCDACLSSADLRSDAILRAIYNVYRAYQLQILSMLTRLSFQTAASLHLSQYSLQYRTIHSWSHGHPLS